MNNVTRALTLFTLAAVGLTQGCSCSDKKKKEVVVEPPPVVVATVDISGTAVKGVVGGGVVSAFALDNKGVIASLPFTTTATDALGKYTIKIPETYIGKPIAFKITPASNDVSKLTCDLSTGCGTDINFGDKYTWPSNSTLSLNLLVPSLNQKKPNNISTFSTIAFEQAKKNLTGANDANAVTTAIQKANSEISNLFGISGPLNEIEVLDITDKAAIKAAVDANKTGTLKLAALNAAILEASKASNPGLSLEASLIKIVKDLSDNGLASNTSDKSVTDLTGILSSVKSILNQVQTVNGNGVNLGALITEVAANLERVRNEPVDVFDRGSATPPDHSSDTEKAYQFADTMRRLLSGGDIVLGQSTLGAESDRFQAQLDAAALASGPDVRAVSEALGKGTEAIIEAYNAYDMNKMLTTYAFEGITVAIAPGANDVAMSVDQGITGVTVKLAGKVALAYSSIENGQTGNGKVALAGSASNGVVTMTVKEGSLAESPKLTKVTVGGVKTTTGETVKFELLVDVAQVESKGVIDPITASGTIRLEMAKVTNDSASDQGPAETGKFSLSFGAKFKNTATDAFDLGFAINGDSMGANFNDIWQGIDPGQPTDVKDFSAAISFNAKLAATDGAAKFNLVASRPTAETTRLALDLAFDVNKIRVSTLISSSEQNSQTVIITNQDKFVMTIITTKVPNKPDSVTGSIMAADGKTKLADIQTAMMCVKASMVTGGKFVCLVDAPK